MDTVTHAYKIRKQMETMFAAPLSKAA